MTGPPNDRGRPCQDGPKSVTQEAQPPLYSGLSSEERAKLAAWSTAASTTAAFLRLVVTELETGRPSVAVQIARLGLAEAADLHDAISYDAVMRDNLSPEDIEQLFANAAEGGAA